MGQQETHDPLCEATQRSQSDGVPFVTCTREHTHFPREPLLPEALQGLDPSAYLGESVAITAETVARTKRPR